MAEQEGYIKLDRNIKRWGWYRNIKTCHLFIHLLISANYKDGTFMGCKIKRGQLAASCATLADKSGLTIDEIRTGLKHLISTGEITTQRRSRFLVITISNYDAYQSLPDHFPNTSRSSPDHFPIISRQEKERKEREEGKEKKKGKKGRSAPTPSLSETHPDTRKVERDEYGHIKLKPRDEGTYEDIPEIYREFCKTYQEYYDYVER